MKYLETFIIASSAAMDRSGRYFRRTLEPLAGLGAIYLGLISPLTN